MTSEHIEFLRDELKKRRLTNTAQKEFIPAQWLSDLLIEGRILASLNAIDGGLIDKDERPQVARDVHRYGLKIFAICLTIEKPDLVYRFFQADQFEETPDHLDKRLPIEEAKLEHVLGLTRIRKDIENKLLEDASLQDKVLGSKPSLGELKEEEAKCIRLCQDFLLVQDMFLSPTFPQGPLHRLLLDSTRLPFLRPLEQGETADPGAADVPQGAFGKVSKETLPARHYEDNVSRKFSRVRLTKPQEQTLWLTADQSEQGMVVVRKELKSQGEEAYRGELRCLRLLAAARHPGLLELYGSYTCNKKHNFLFRGAVHGDLHDLLGRERRLPGFKDDDAFYLAFCNLASALEQVHCYSNDDLKLEMIGCHHDLKPRNVLVDDGRFILADFGLATMRGNDEDPNTEAQDRDTYFAAPENVDYIEGTRHKVGPPGDIWSLGCILAEVFTFMRGGRTAVNNFRDRRQTLLDLPDTILILTAFHDGRGRLSKGTVDHLDELESAIRVETKASKRPVPELGLLQLVREMLTVDVLARPDIKRVLQRLRCITLQKKAQPVFNELLDSPHSGDVEFIIERQVFREWLGRLAEAGQEGQLYLPNDAAFDQLCKTLDALLDELRLLAQDDVGTPLFSQLRRLNEQLLSCLDTAGRLRIRRAVERDTIATVHDLARESGLPETTMSETSLLASGPNANVLRRLAAAQVKKRMGKRNGQAVPRLQSTDVTLLNPPKGPATPRTFRLGMLKQGGDAVEIPVVVEEMTIEPKHAKAENSDRLFRRLENVLSFSLGNTDTLSDFRALNCSGIYFDMAKELIGLTYRYPSNTTTTTTTVTTSSSDGPARVVSLAQLLTEHPDTVDYKHDVVIGLDDRIQLARDLALAVSHFHQIGWMHKNLSPYNVLFFHDNATAAPPSAARSSPRPPPRHLALSAPALIGFSHSRPEHATVMSSKRYTTDPELRAYHHPEYAGEGGGAEGGSGSGRSPEAYRPEFDYYSLGLVLLELALWRPLREIVLDRRNRTVMKKHLLQRVVPFVTGPMGEAYMRATEACLSGVLGSGDGGSVQEDFSRLVIEPLEKLLGI